MSIVYFYWISACTIILTALVLRVMHLSHDDLSQDDLSQDDLSEDDLVQFKLRSILTTVAFLSYDTFWH